MKLKTQLWNLTELPTETAPKLVLLHGMGGTGALWRPIATQLETQFAILAPDQRGHGGSIITIESTTGSTIENALGVHEEFDKPDYSPLAYGQDLIETLEEAHFYPSWILGHSMGVRTAVAFAHLKPKWTEGLILVDLGLSGLAGGGLGEGLANFLKKLPKKFQSREEARLFMSENCPDPSIAQYLMAVSVKTPQNEVIFPFDHDALIQTTHAAREVSIRNWVRDLGSQGMPILVLRGALSKVWTHEEFETEKASFADLKSVVFHEVDNAGHGLPFEQRLTFVELIKEFIQKSSVQLHYP